MKKKSRSLAACLIAVIFACPALSEGSLGNERVLHAKSACVESLQSEIIVQNGQPAPPRHNHIASEMRFPGVGAQTTEAIYTRFRNEPIQVRPGYTMWSTYDDVHTVCGYDDQGKLYVRLDTAKQIPVRTW